MANPSRSLIIPSTITTKLSPSLRIMREDSHRFIFHRPVHSYTTLFIGGIEGSVDSQLCISVRQGVSSCSRTMGSLQETDHAWMEGMCTRVMRCLSAFCFSSELELQLPWLQWKSFTPSPKLARPAGMPIIRITIYCRDYASASQFWSLRVAFSLCRFVRNMNKKKL